MKVIAIDVTDTRATVELRPSWVGRLFGAKSCIMESRFDDADILLALERRPMHDLPIARAREITR